MFKSHPLPFPLATVFVAGLLQERYGISRTMTGVCIVPQATCWRVVVDWYDSHTLRKENNTDVILIDNIDGDFLDSYGNSSQFFSDAEKIQLFDLLNREDKLIESEEIDPFCIKCHGSIKETSMFVTALGPVCAKCNE